MDTRDDFDSCQERWEYYQKRYPELKIQIKDVKNKNGRGVWKYGSVEISGDCFFNFNDKKIEAFIKNIQCDPETKMRLLACTERHHTNENCVLMPTTGGMNKVKGKIYYRDSGFVIAGVGRPTNKCYDRPDTFLFYLNNFFEHKESVFDLSTAGEYLSNSVFKEALQSFNFNDLYYFLAGFKDIYEYCGLFYGIDKAFVDRMINEGKRPIRDKEDLNNYMQLAEDFWRIQAEILQHSEGKK